jgi:hypothetical protein
MKEVKINENNYNKIWNNKKKIFSTNYINSSSISIINIKSLNNDYINFLNSNKSVVLDIIHKFLESNNNKIIKNSNLNEINNNIVIWKKLKGNLYNKLKELFDKEKEHTFIYIIYIHFSILNVNNKLKIYINENEITGNINNDIKHIKIMYKNNKLNEKLNIFTYGPSGSGKSYLFNEIISLLFNTFKSNNTDAYINKINNILSKKKDFLTLDGGINREHSIIYKLLKIYLYHLMKYIKYNSKNTKKITFNNTKTRKETGKQIYVLISNLKFTIKKKTDINNLIYMIKNKDLFNASDYFKKYLYNYFNNNVNLYIPLTSKLKLIKKTDISLFINIYKCNKNCVYKNYDKLKCNNIYNSGIKRSIIEIKRYSAINYNNSYNIAINTLNNKYGGLLIHNCGTPNNYSIIICYELVGNYILNSLFKTQKVININLNNINISIIIYKKFILIKNNKNYINNGKIINNQLLEQINMLVK